MTFIPNILSLIILINFISCTSGDNPNRKTLKVTATAYNNLPRQTHSDHYAIGAWGDTLKPGMNVIAVSRDLLDSGLTHNTAVHISGFEDSFLVMDKMNARWTKKIDIYMGHNKQKALKWGKKKVVISWDKPKENTF